jgi:putative oxidoreductase
VTLDRLIDTGQVLLLVRVVLGASLVYYAFPKIRDLEANAEEFVGMGLKPGRVWGTLIAFVEFGGGLALLLGLYAELAAALFGFQMLVGSVWKHKSDKALDEYFYDIQLFALCAIVLHFGAGAYSLRPFRAVTFLRWDVAIGAVILAVVLAHLPEILGQRYRQWGVERW